MIVLYIILALIVVFLAAVLIRTAAFRPTAEESGSFEDVSFDRDTAISDLAALVKCKTVSDADETNEDGAEFDRLTGMDSESCRSVGSLSPFFSAPRVIWSRTRSTMISQLVLVSLAIVMPPLVITDKTCR